MSDSQSFAEIRACKGPNNHEEDDTVSIVPSRAKAEYGVYTFSAVVVRAKPSSMMYIYVKIDNFNTQGNDLDFIRMPSIFAVSVSSCQSGQSYSEELTCDYCTIGTYMM